MVTYDIADDQRRQRIARALAGYGERVQYSVFECRLDERELLQLRHKIAAVADTKCDRIRWYPLCRPCHGRIIQQGTGNPPGDEGFYLV
jgi:CRISPR-associated protein Cas2